VPEACTGLSPQCPPDVLAVANLICRAVAGGCDVAELCTGFSAQCAADAYRAAGFVCAPASSQCSGPATCSGFVRVLACGVGACACVTRVFVCAESDMSGESVLAERCGVQ
jgi:hypothetical protein